MTKIKRKSTNTDSKAFIAFFAVIDSLLLLAALVFLVLALLFRSNAAPYLFSHRVYLMNSDAFSLVKKGSAVITSQVPFEGIAAGNIVIFTDEEEKIYVGEVQSSDFSEGVYTFSLKNDAGVILTVGQSRILGKGIYYSEFLGGLVSFLTSPSGVCVIALLPCLAFVIYDVIKAVKRKIPQPTVTTVKKQDETPTYIPPQKPKSDISGGIDYDDDLAFAPRREKMVEAAGLYSAHQKRSENIYGGSYGSYDRTGKAVNRPQSAVAVSEKDIDKLIREAKAERTRNQAVSSGAREQLRIISEANAPKKRVEPQPAEPASQQKQDPSEYPERVKSAPAKEQMEERPEPPTNPLLSKLAQESRSEYEEELSTISPPAERTPPKRPSPRLSPRVSKLDSLLQEGSQSNYNIDDILNRLG